MKDPNERENIFDGFGDYEPEEFGYNLPSNIQPKYIFGNVGFEFSKDTGRKIPVQIGQRDVMKFVWGKYEFFLWLLTCSDEQLNRFVATKRSEIVCDANWAYDFLREFMDLPWSGYDK